MQRSSAKFRDRASKTSIFVFSSAGEAGNYRFGAPRPVNPRAPRAKKESAVKPGSVLDSHSSGMRVAAQL